MVPYSCFTFVRKLRSVNSRCPLLDRCSLLDLWIQHLLGLVLRVLMYLSLLLIVTVANELVTLRCASMSASASQERKQRGTVFEILLESISTLLLSELALFCRKLFPSTFQDSGCPREDVDTELSASTRTQSWNSVFSRLSMSPLLLHLVTLFCNTVLPSGRFSPTVFSCLRAAFLQRSITAVILTSKLDHFFTRAS